MWDIYLEVASRSFCEIYKVCIQQTWTAIEIGRNRKLIILALFFSFLSRSYFLA